MAVRRGRRIHGFLLGFIALNAFGGGLYGLLGARGVPAEWLVGSPFRSYFLPSLFLFVAVGGVCASAAWAVLASRPSARVLSLGAGVLLLAWIAAQVAIIGYVSWLQPAVAGAGIVVLWLTKTMRRA